MNLKLNQKEKILDEFSTKQSIDRNYCIKNDSNYKVLSDIEKSNVSAHLFFGLVGFKSILEFLRKKGLTMRKHHGFILNNELEDKKTPYGIDYYLNVRLHFYEYHELSKMFYQQDSIDDESYIEYKILTQYVEFDSLCCNYLMKQIKIDSDSFFYNLNIEQLKELKKELDDHLESIEF